MTGVNRGSVGGARSRSQSPVVSNAMAIGNTRSRPVEARVLEPLSGFARMKRASTRGYRFAESHAIFGTPLRRRGAGIGTRGRVGRKCESK
jgi:hypothetical protein